MCPILKTGRVWVQCSSCYFIGSISILVFVNFQLSDVLFLSDISSWFGSICFMLGYIFTGLLLFKSQGITI